MAEPGDEIRPDDDEVGGGAIKSFLEHLEDLRWTLIKSGTAILLAMMVCLLGNRTVVSILKWPLDRASKRTSFLFPDDTNRVVTFQIGSTPIKSLRVNTNHIGSLDLGTNQQVTVQLEPAEIGGKQVLTMTVVPNTGEPESTMPRLVFLSISGSFFTSVHIAFFGGLFLACPFLFYYVGQFVMPALKIREKKYFLRAFYVGLGLFLTGVSFAYFLIMPAALKFAKQYGEWMGVDVFEWTADSYFSFVVKFMLGMGLGFELPVVLLALVKIGVLDYAKLSQMRRYMIIINLVLGGLLTTPEVITQIFMAVALQVLFEASVWIAWYWERQAKKRAGGSQAS